MSTQAAMTAAARSVNRKRGVRPGSVSASARTPEIGTMNSRKPCNEVFGSGLQAIESAAKSRKAMEAIPSGVERTATTSRRMAPTRRSTAAAASASTVARTITSGAERWAIAMTSGIVARTIAAACHSARVPGREGEMGDETADMLALTLSRLSHGVRSTKA